MEANLKDYNKRKDEYIQINTRIGQEFLKLKKYFKEDSYNNLNGAIKSFELIINLIESRDYLIKEDWNTIRSVSSRIDKIEDKTTKDIVTQLNFSLESLFEEFSKIISIKKTLVEIIKDLKGGKIKTTKNEFENILKKLRYAYPKGLNTSLKNKILIIENNLTLFSNLDAEKLNSLFKSFPKISSTIIVISLSIITIIIFSDSPNIIEKIIGTSPILLGPLFLHFSFYSKKRKLKNHKRLVNMLKSIPQ